MRRGLLVAGATLALTSTLALAAPESLLPDTFGDPPPAPAPAPAPRPTAAPAPAPAVTPPAPGTSVPVIQPLPQVSEPVPQVTLPSNFPSLAEIERMSPDEVDELFGLKPKFDIPPAARRAVREVGVIGPAEGGFPVGSIDDQPAQLIRAALAANRGTLVSRWGHILLRRALASRLDAPRGMDPVDFAALRAGLLNRLGEGMAARALVQDIDSANYNTALARAAFDAYLATGDVLGMCPVAQLRSTLLDDGEWKMTRAICSAYSGDPRQAERELQRILYYGEAPRIDALLAQRFAGAAGEGRRAVNIEWNNVEELNPWRFALSRALGVEIPAELRDDAGLAYDIRDALIPAVPLAQRIAVADRAAARGVISSEAMIGLYSQLFTEEIEGNARERAVTLREAYAARDLSARLSALRELWDNGSAEERYGRLVLTAYAAARLPVSEDLLDDAPRIVGSMLAAGLDRNAVRWGSAVPEGSEAWALLVLAQPERDTQVSGGAVQNFIGEDASASQRKSRFLVAGLAGLDRLDMGTASGLADRLGVTLERESPWSRQIDRAAELGNPTLVALLAGLGMQGSGWDKMTARHLFHIVRALNTVGLEAEARMIAAEAVVRA